MLHRPRIYTVTPNPGIDRTLTVPSLLLNEVLRSTDLRLDAGGKGFNVSRALKALGVDSTAIAFLGGPAGQLEEQMLRALGVTVHAVPIQEETRTCTVITEPDGRQHVKVNEPGPVVQLDEQAALLNLVQAEARAPDLWVTAGSLPRGVGAGFHRAIVERVQARGARAVLDASGAALLEALKARPFMVKPNALEAEQATGLQVRSVDEAVAAVRWLRERAEIVALSLGADGMVAGAGQQIVHARPPAILARNAVGAGDASVAGMLDGLARELAFEDVVRWGVACGTAAAMRAGVDFASHADVAEVAAQVAVTRIG